MGAILVLTPVIVSTWPAVASAIASAATSLGYSAAKGISAMDQTSDIGKKTGVALDVPNSQVLTDQLGLSEKLSFTRDGVTVTIHRDDRGQASIHVNGTGQSHEELQRIGEEMSQRLVRDYVYQQIKHGMEAQNFVMVEETEDESHAIHMTVRHWEH